MSKVLLTGATGFIALHILNVLLDRGKNVVATIRSEKKLPTLERVAADKKGTLIVEYITDNNEPHGYDHVFKKHPEITTVIHTASPVFFAAKDAVKEVIEPAVNGTLNVLKAAKEHGPQVDQFILTSSISAAIYPLSPEPGHVYTEKDWSTLTVEVARAHPYQNAYFASKKYAEQAAWKFMTEEEPQFTLTAILPAYVWGPMLGDVSAAEAINGSNSLLYYALKGKLPQETPFFYVHVRDVAEIHANAIGNPAAVNKRWLAFDSVPALSYDIVKLASEDETFKDALATKPDESLDTEQLRKQLPQFDGSVSSSEHHQVYTPLKETVSDSLQSFIDLGVWN